MKDALHHFCTHTLLPEMQAVYPESRVETQVIGEVDGLETTRDNEARDLVMELTGANGADVVPFGTEAGIFQSLGLDVVVCGPGSIDQAHKPDEYVSIDQMRQCLDMLQRLATKLV